MKTVKTLLIFLFASFLVLSMQAQTKVMQKEVKKAFKSMTAEQQEALLKYANLGLSGKEEGVMIADKKSLNKYFKLLPPKHQEQVVQYAQNQLASATTEKLAVNTPPTPPAPPTVEKAPPRAPKAPQAVQLRENPNAPKTESYQRPANAAPATPPQPAWIVKAESMAKTQVEWYEQSYDFGKIVEGDVVTHTFRFKNVGDHPLQLTRVKPSCGCTSPEWSNEPIAPGAEGLVSVSFNSSHKRGMQSKSVVITYNGDPINKVLTFRAQVEPKEAPAGGNNE